MAGPNFVLDKGWAAGGALAKFHAVKLTGTETVTQASVLGEKIIGVGQETVSADDATRGRVAAVRVLGITRAVAGAAVAQFAEVSVNASGRFITAAAGQRVCGIALNAAAANGDHFDVLLTPAGRVA